MNADCGRRRPAIKSRSDVLPAPEGPKTAVTWLCSSTSTSMVKSATGREIVFRSKSILTPSLAHEVFAPPHRHKCHQHRDSQQPKRVSIVSQLHRLENGQRERGGLSWNIACDHDRGAERAQGPGK